jgi:hypothetical protein
MEHVEDDLLALAALGETLPDDVVAHLEQCDACRAEVAAFGAVVAVGRSVTPLDRPAAAPAHVWENIQAELGLSIADPSTQPRDAEPGSVVPLRRGNPSRRTPRGRSSWILAAAAGIVVGGVGGGLLVNELGGSSEAPPTVVAEVGLDPLPDWQASSGIARVETDATGARTLVVSLSGQTPDEGFQEVWLIDRDVTRLVSLGVLEGTEGRLPIPASVDLDDYAVVDVSAEPLDGDPTHSGDSIVRGVLGT